MELFIFLLIIVYFAFSKVSKSEPKNKYYNDNEEEDTEEEDDDEEEEEYEEDSFNTYIAGVDHYLTEDNIGAFVGIVAPEPGSQYDDNAIAVYNMNDQVIGYIPRYKQADYKKFSNNAPYPCVGYIIPSNSNKYTLYGRVKVIKPYNEEYINHEISSYLSWAENKYGEKFVPDDLKNQYYD